MNEEEKRLHRCCFTGHRPEKLDEDEAAVKAWLSAQIDQAISDGFVTFITGMGMGVDIWAGQLVLEKKATNASIHLIAATPYPTFSYRWKDDWKSAYKQLWEAADYRITVCKNFSNSAFQARNEWMVDHSNRVIAYFNGSPGGTMNTINYAKMKNIEIISNHI